MTNTEPMSAEQLAQPEIVGWRWRFLNQNDKTWRYCERRPNFDPTVVEAEPLALHATTHRAAEASKE